MFGEKIDKSNVYLQPVDGSSLEGHSITLFELSMWDFCSDLSMSFKFDWYLFPVK